MKWLYEYYPAPSDCNKEKEDASLSFGYSIDELLFSGKSKFQQVDVIKTKVYGTALFLDHLMMTTEKDEFIYHEILSHVPASMVKKPERVLIIGGGDGGIARELCKYPSVKEIVVAEIDEMVIEVSKKYLPSIACSFDDPRVKVECTDGAAFVKAQKDESFDILQ